MYLSLAIKIQKKRMLVLGNEPLSSPCVVVVVEINGFTDLIF